VKGASAKSAANDFTPSKLVAMLQVGLPFRELQDLQTSLAVPTEKLAPMLGISKATFHRRKGDASKLPPAVSDRVVRYAQLLGQAFRVFEDLEAAKQWLSSPQFGLGGAVPLDYAKTEIGAREVENLLGRIEYGVLS
jgi:putative toxin-antitoxin system antitoxin component (TIGR02293 family)